MTAWGARPMSKPTSINPSKKGNIMAKPTTSYWAYKGNEDMALRNGSFVRSSVRRPGQYAIYMNGDYMETVAAIDEEKYAPVDTKHALRLLPKVCGGKGL